MSKHKEKTKKKKDVKKDPLQERLIKGLLAFSEEDYDKAKVSFLSILKSYPDNPLLHHMVGEAMLRSGNGEEGKKYYYDAFSKDQNLWLTRGIAHLKLAEGNRDEAEKILLDFIEKNPESSWGYLNLVSFYRAIDQGNKAMEALDKATSCATELPVVWSLVQVMLDYDSTSEISRQFSKVMVLVPKNWLGYYLLARCFIKQQSFDNGMENIKQAVGSIKSEMASSRKSLHPIYEKLMSYIYMERAMISFVKKEYNDVISNCLDALRINKKLWETMYFLAVGYLYEGRMDKGRSYLAKFCENLEKENDEIKEIYGPFMLSARLMMGQTYISQGNYQEAADIFERVIDINPEIVEAYLNAGYSYFCLGKIENSKSVFKKLLEFKSDNLLALNNLGFLEMHQGNLQVSKEYFRKAIDVSPGYSLPYTNLGFILVYEGNYEEAEHILIKALKSKEPEDATLKVIYPSSREENMRTGGPPVEENKTISSYIASICNLGTCFARRKNYKDANLCFDKLISSLHNAHFGYRGKAWTYFLENDVPSALIYIRKAFEKNSMNKVLQSEFEFIQEVANKFTGTKKMASVLEGFFSQQSMINILEKPVDINNILKEVEISLSPSGSDAVIWNNLLVDIHHLPFMERKINQSFEEHFKELQMVSSWQEINLASNNTKEA